MQAALVKASAWGAFVALAAAWAVEQPSPLWLGLPMVAGALALRSAAADVRRARAPRTVGLGAALRLAYLQGERDALEAAFSPEYAARLLSQRHPHG